MKKLVLLACALSAGGAQANLLVNGSFEQGSGVYAGGAPVYDNLAGGSTVIAGWTTVGAGVEWFRPANFSVGPARDGFSVIDLADFTSTGSPRDGVEQTVATVAGERYRIDFSGVTSQSNGRTGTGTIELWLNDSLFSTHALTNYKSFWSMDDWQDFSVQFVADGPTTKIGFLSSQNALAHYANVDAFSVVADPLSAVPEPATWLMWLAGFGLVGSIARRRLDAAHPLR